MICGLCKKDKPCGCDAKLAELSRLSENQCMGCQAGWPLKQYVTSRSGFRVPAWFHDVEGGYPHEVVSCTKDRYEEHDATL